jgi:hypothetical protein
MIKFDTTDAFDRKRGDTSLDGQRLMTRAFKPHHPNLLRTEVITDERQEESSDKDEEGHEEKEEVTPV